MVRELKLEGCVEFVEPQAAFSFLFGDDRFVKRYHKEMNEDPYAEVSSWTDDGRRTVKFAAPINAPNVIKRVIGVETLKVTEEQQCFTVGNRFTIRSDPKIEHPTGFNTKAEMVLALSESGKGSTVYITATLECKAAVWGVQGTIENFMEAKAKKSFLGWLKMARLFCQEQLALATGLPYSITDAEEDLSIGDSSDDEFFDFSEEDEKALILSGESRTLGVIYSREGDSGLQNWIMGQVMGQLNGLHVTCDASRTHIEQLNRKLQKMEEDIGMVQQQLQRGMIIPQSHVWGLVGLGVATGVLLGAGHVYLKAYIQSRGS
ncbi:hypothetical protein Mapa_005998 [Marchantia paleacea]|nr:hypothetical protein Mapa_005998 [Marchantia paleacea]